MKMRFFRFVISVTILCFIKLSSALTASASPEPAKHYCGFTGHQYHKHDTRRYARTFAANLNVGEPRTVRMIYFTPNDWQYRADVVQKMKDEIRTVQTFYAEQMEAHGYEKVTFRVETDAQGEPMVHHVNGKHPFSYYDNTLGSKVFSELEETYDFRANIYFIVLGTDALRQEGGAPALGVGYNSGKNGGMFLVANEFNWGLVAHELGHSFGLGHDFRDGAHIMSYGPGWNRLSACAAEFLSMHTYFNSGAPIEVGEPPTIKLVSPRRYPPGSRSIPVRLQVNDSDGVHQVLLSAQGSLQACRGLEGRRDSVAEFEYEGGFGGGDVFTSLSNSMRHTFLVHAVDTEGNVSDTFFSVFEQSPHSITTLEGHTYAVRRVSFSRNGLLASGGWDRTIRLWDVESQQNIATFEVPPRLPISLCVSIAPDGTVVAQSAGGWISLWDIATQQNIATFKGHAAWVYEVSFSPDGRTLASGADDNTVKLWDVETQQNIDTLPHTGVVFSVAFSPDGAILASGSRDGTVRLWDAAKREHIATLPHEDIVLSVAFSPDGKILASGGRGGIKLWDVGAESRLAALVHGGTVSSVSFSPDGDTLASGRSDGTIKLWDMPTRENFATFGPTSPVSSMSFSPDGRTIASGTAEGTIELWDTSKLIELRLEAFTEVDIPDLGLRTAIATALGKPLRASIVRRDMLDLTRLELEYDANITNLTGLEYASNLRSLFINSTSRQIQDITPITALKRLRELLIGWSVQIQ